MEYAIFFLVVALIGLLIYKGLKRPTHTQPDGEVEKDLLEKHVDFYKKLDEEDKKVFLSRVRNFLKKVNVKGVETDVTDLDRVLVGAAAIIPIHHFPQWEYTKLHEVLLYPKAFDTQFSTCGDDKHVVGMVGTGAMNNSMILSRPFLESGFLHSHNNSNTGIHEFVHLIDRADGETDGEADVLMDHRLTDSWKSLVNKEIHKIKSGHSEIDPYAATNHAEFFAVVSEYFFKNPSDLRKHHPELYRRLDAMFEGKKVEEELQESSQ